MTTFTVETIAAQPAAAIRAEVPMAELPGVFDRAFPEVMRAVGVQGVPITGPLVFAATVRVPRARDELPPLA